MGRKIRGTTQIPFIEIIKGTQLVIVLTDVQTYSFPFRMQTPV